MGATDIPTRFPLAVDPQNRDNTTNKDAKLVNGYLEKTADGGYSVYKRAGLSDPYPLPGGASGAGLGIFNWQGSIYFVIGNILYEGSPTSETALGNVSNDGLQYIFSSNLSSPPTLVLGNGIHAYYYPFGGTLTPMSGGNAPGVVTRFVPGWAYLDGTMYYADTYDLVWGSNINDVTTWDTTNEIQVQIEPSSNVAMAKHLVYPLVMTGWTTEVFYDAQEPANSPLGPVQGAKMNYGCASAGSVLDIDGQLFWVSKTRNGAAQVVCVDNLHINVISTPYIEKLIQFSNFSLVWSWCFKGGGHCFYVVTLEDLNLTLAYDIKEKLWSQWTDLNGNYLPISGSTFYGTSCILQGFFTGALYEMSMLNYTDSGNVITVDLYTPNFDAGVDRRKVLNLLRFNADQTPGSVLQVRCNDQDYSSTSWTNFRRVDLGVKRPFLDRCGSFYRRAYHLRHQCNTPLRITSLDMQLDIGTL